MSSYSLLLGQCEDNIERRIREVQSGPEVSYLKTFCCITCYASTELRQSVCETVSQRCELCIEPTICHFEKKNVNLVSNKELYNVL